MDKVIVIVGPTAVGKTDISIEVAKYLNTEIINADASQFRKFLNIGTAKIDQTKTSVKHHLIDIIDPLDDYSIKEFQTEARNLIAALNQQGMIPLLVGGSGLYVNATIFDYNLSNEGRNQVEEDKYQNLDNIALHKVLEELDYPTSLKIHPNNRKRVLRAIENAQTGIKISENICNNQEIYDALVISLDAERDILYDRINKRVDIMFDNGWLKEAADISNEYPLSKIKEIGYKEIGEYFDGNLDFDEMKDIIKQNTRHYAKRQITWFKNKINAINVKIDYDNVQTAIDEIIELIKEFQG